MANDKLNSSKSGNESQRNNKRNRPKRQNKKDFTSDSKGDKGQDTHYADKKGIYCSGTMGTENDPSWYNKLRTLVENVTMIPFNTQAGTTPDYNNREFTKQPVTGVISLPTMLGPGRALSPTDGVNIAATGLFQFMRSKLSTIADYAAADVMMYILAADNMASLYCHILRCFGSVNLYSSLNLNYPRVLFNAYGWGDEEYTKFITNLANYRARFNSLVYKASTVYFPTDFTLTDRHTWMFSNIWMDSDDAKAQLYVHVPYAIYQLNETDFDNGTALQPVPMCTGANWHGVDHSLMEYTMGMDYLLDVFDACIEAFRNSDSMNKIAGDMRRAFEDRGVWKFAYADEAYMVIPTKSDEVLSQIENTTILPDPGFVGLNFIFNSQDIYGSWFITQDVEHNVITFNPQWQTHSTAWGDTTDIGAYAVADAASYWEANKVFNMHWNNPSGDDIAVATRGMVWLTDANSAEGFVGATSFGSDFVVGCWMFKRGNIDGRFSSLITQVHNFIDISAISPQYLYSWVAADWSPIIYCGIKDESMPTGRQLQGVSALCEFDNFTYIDHSTVDRMNNNIIMSMWSIPQLGAFEG